MAEVKAKKVERIYIIPLRKAYDYIRTKRTPRAVKIVRDHLARHFKVDGEKVKLSAMTNSALWRDSIQRPPRKIKVRAVLEDGIVRAYMMDEKEDSKVKAPKQKGKKDEKKQEKKVDVKKPAEKKEAKKEEKAEEKKPVKKAETPIKTEKK
jgi:large subunit ribosomal protein L31e